MMILEERKKYRKIKMCTTKHKDFFKVVLFKAMWYFPRDRYMGRYRETELSMYGNLKSAKNIYGERIDYIQLVHSA